MTNERVIANYFKSNKNCHSLNVYSTYSDLINYNTIMVHKEDDIFYVNISYYSVTTRKIQSYINREIAYRTEKIIYYYGNKYGDNYKDEDSQVKIIEYFDATNNSGCGISKIDDEKVTFYNFYYNCISNAITRTLKTDKEGRIYFSYNKNKWYLDEIMRKKQEYVLLTNMATQEKWKL